MGKIGVVLAILAIGSVAVMLLAMLWARLGALGDAPILAGPGIRPDELGRRRRLHTGHESAEGASAVITLLRPREEHISAS